jgi:insertion element IS1 protein InsB
VTNELTITIQGLKWEDIQQASFYEGEVQVRALLQLIGQELTVQLLRSKAVEAPTLAVGAETYYRKEASLGHYHTLYGEVVISRPLYQTSAGGATLCPLERNCQLSFGSATPLLAEVVKMWSFVGKKKEPRWLWHAIDHHTRKVLAYVFGRRTDEVFVKLKTLLEPFGITRSYTDYWGAYERNLPPEVHSPGKRNTQQIERKHLTLRTRIKRLVRKTICFSKSIAMHDIVIGLFINRYEFGLPV